jgi:hypothetical protein
MSWPGIEPRPLWGGREHSRKDPFEQLVKSYSEHLHMSARPVKIVRDSTIYQRPKLCLGVGEAVAPEDITAALGGRHQEAEEPGGQGGPGTAQRAAHLGGENPGVPNVDAPGEHLNSVAQVCCKSAVK